MRVRLLFFAVLRDVTGKSEAMLDLPEGCSAADVWSLLRRDYAALHGFAQPLTAVNENYTPVDQPLRDGDELAFIPPVAGG